MAKKKRVKSAEPKIIPIADWEGADKQVCKVGELQENIKEAEHAAADDINEVKLVLANKTKSFHGEIKQITTSLEAFAVNHQAQFGKKRSRKLSFGSLGWRKSTSMSIKKTTLDLIKKVFSRAKAKTLIHVKETADKEALAKLTDEQLVSVGARRKNKDVFYVEPDLPESVNYT